MSKIQAVDNNCKDNHPVYNAVKIKINNPQNMPNHIKTADNGEYNAVSIEVNNPEIKANKKVYTYPTAKGPVTYDKTGIGVANLAGMPVIPVAYQTNLINNRTFINAELEVEEKCDKCDSKTPVVPEPNITTPEKEKNPSFHGISFRGETPQIKADAGIKPAIDTKKVLTNLKSKDYDTQALQLEEIAKCALDDTTKAIPYVTTSIFSAMESIVNKDTSSLEGPTDEQTEIRKKIIVNAITAEQIVAQGNKPKESDMPFKITEQEAALAEKLSPREMAERNKEYSIYTLAALAKVYADETEKTTGNVVPLTDMPGVSTFVDALKTSKNPGVKIAAINAFLHLRRPEYKTEIESILKVVSADNNQFVARNAQQALTILG